MKEKIFSLNWALLESPFSITCVCVLGMGQLGSEGPDSLVRSHPSAPQPVYLHCRLHPCAHTIRAVRGRQGLPGLPVPRDSGVTENPDPPLRGGLGTQRPPEQPAASTHLSLRKRNMTGSLALLDGVAQHSVRTTLRLLFWL